jgi:hypothetical protein
MALAPQTSAMSTPSTQTHFTLAYLTLLTSSTSGTILATSAIRWMTLFIFHLPVIGIGSLHLVTWTWADAPGHYQLLQDNYS